MSSLEVYLDNAATTRPRDEVIEVVLEMLKNEYGNPSSLHRKGLIVEKKIKKSRKIIANFLNVLPEEIFFTSGGTESNNMSIQGIVNKYGKNKKHLITTKIEHPSVLNIFKYYETQGYDVTYLDVDEYGYLDLDQLEKELNSDTVLVSIMMVNNETGSIQPVEEIVEIVHAKSDAKIHIDGIQAVGKLNLDISRLKVDALSFSGHKFYGPKGIGGLYIKRNLNINPIYKGSGQENHMRPGTENTPGIVGMAKALECIELEMNTQIEHLKQLKNYLIERFTNELERIKINSKIDETSAPHIVNISFDGIMGEVFLHYLEGSNVYVSTGSACSSKNKGGSHVLKAMGFSDKEIDSSIRISFSKYNTIEEIDYAVDEMIKVVKEIRKIMKR